MENLLQEVRKCRICASSLPNPPKPILAVSERTRILIIGQAPGQKVHDRGIPWEDQSGDTLREWLGVTKEQFSNTALIGTMPMGFCFPGCSAGGSGDAPPRPECKPQWHERILSHLTELKLTLIIGQYAMKAYLGENQKRNLTETVRAYREYLPQYFPLVHPSPLNFRWHRKNPWFKNEVLPVLREKVQEIIMMN